MIVIFADKHIRTMMGGDILALSRAISKDSLSMLYDEVNDITIDESKVIGKSRGYDERRKFENLIY